MKRIRCLNVLLIAIMGVGGIGLAGLSGCAGTRVNLEDGRTLSIERVPSASIYFHGVRAYLKGGGLVVSGEVKRDRTSVVTGDGHIDMAVIDPGGRVVEAVSAIYIPRTLSRRSHRGSYFEAFFKPVPSDGSVIRIAPHRLKLPEGIYDREFDCGKNAAISGRSGQWIVRGLS